VDEGDGRPNVAFARNSVREGHVVRRYAVLEEDRMMEETPRPPELEGESDTRRSFGKHRPGEGGFGLVEAIVAIVVFGIGTVAVAGLTLTAGAYANRAAVETDQTMVSNQLFSELRQEDFSSVASGTRTFTTGEHSYDVEVTVAQPSADVKTVVAVVSGVGPFSPDTFHTRIHRSGGYPTGP
jgi:type II secretory pathway pseudopilin PulG